MTPRTKVPEMVRLYTEDLWGCGRISQYLDCDESTVRYHLRKLKVLDSSRAHKPTGLPWRVRRPRSQEFSNPTKQLRFNQEKGICQECRTPIESWRKATYHHIKLCRDGGTSHPDNCMVLHGTCHEDPVVFKKLHGFDFYLIQSDHSNKIPIEPKYKRLDLNQVKDLYEQGLKQSEILSILGCAPSSLQEARKRLGLVKQVKTVPLEELILLRNQGLSYSAISEKLGVSVQNISQRLSRASKKDTS